MVFSAGIKCVDDSRPQAVMFPRVLEVIFSGQIIGTNPPRLVTPDDGDCKGISWNLPKMPEKFRLRKYSDLPRLFGVIF